MYDYATSVTATPAAAPSTAELSQKAKSKDSSINKRKRDKNEFWSSSSSKPSVNPKRSFQWIGIVNLYSSPTKEVLGALAQNFDTFTTPGIKPFLIKSFSNRVILYQLVKLKME